MENDYDYILSPDIIRKPNSIIHEKPKIDMLHDSSNGQVLIDALYKEKGVTDMPERFKLIVRYFSEPIPTEDPINQWKFMQWSTGEKQFCCCGHGIENSYFIKNIRNNNILRVGSDCIEKIGGLSIKEEFKQVKKIIKQNPPKNIKIGYESSCGECKKEFLSENKSDQYCSNCLGKCNACNRPTLKRDIIKGYCSECHEKIIKCKHCEEDFLSKNGSDQYCNGCKSQFKQCCMCGKEFLNKNAGTHCEKCYHKCNKCERMIYSSKDTCAMCSISGNN